MCSVRYGLCTEFLFLFAVGVLFTESHNRQKLTLHLHGDGVIEDSHYRR